MTSLQSDAPPEKRRSYLIRGPCRYAFGRLECPCTEGARALDIDSLSGLSDAICEICEHSLDVHNDYQGPRITNPNETIPSLRAKPYKLPSGIAYRQSFVNGLIDLAHQYPLILIRGTPASGKTTIRKLIANALLDKFPNIPVHVVIGWDKEEVTANKGWDVHLKIITGTRGSDWPTKPAFLLFDEAQQSYWDKSLWSSVFKDISPHSERPSVIFFSSYGSPGRGNHGFGEHKYFQTSPYFADQQMIGMRPEESSLHVLLSYEEAMDMINLKMRMVGQPISKDLMDCLYSVSEGHAGCLAALISILGKREFDDIRRKGGPYELHVVQRRLFNHPETLLRLLRSDSFCRGLPSDEILKDTSIARIFKRVVKHETVREDSFEEDLHERLDGIWRNGWLHSQKVGEITSYRFASAIHRWYCGYMLHERVACNTLPFASLLDLVKAIIRRFEPIYLSDSPRSLSGRTSPVEDQYQKEFYRSFYSTVDGQVLVSPEYVAKYGKGGGSIDFLIPAKKWGVELLKNRSKIDEHMQRFEQGGQYHDLLVSSVMEDYIVLDFTTSIPEKLRPNHSHHLYHVVFVNNFREITIVNSGDLSIVDSFTLSENQNPVH